MYMLQYALQTPRSAVREIERAYCQRFLPVAEADACIVPAARESRTGERADIERVLPRHVEFHARPQRFPMLKLVGDDQASAGVDETVPEIQGRVLYVEPAGQRCRRLGRRLCGLALRVSLQSTAVKTNMIERANWSGTWADILTRTYRSPGFRLVDLIEDSASAKGSSARSPAAKRSCDREELTAAKRPGRLRGTCASRGR